MKRRLPSLRERRVRVSTVALLALVTLGGAAATQVPVRDHPTASDGGGGGADVATSNPLIRDLGLPSSLPPAPGTPTDDALLASPSWSGIPTTVYTAYTRAAESVQKTDPGCHLTWPLLAAIGKVESGHAEGGAVNPQGTMVEALYGPELNGTHGTAPILQAVFGNNRPQWSRAEGPMQFLPSTWASWGADGNGDGAKNDQNVYDATLGAAHYLCAGNVDLATSGGLRDAILRYNPSLSYLETVASWLRVYSKGAVVVPDEPNGWHASSAATNVSDRQSQPAAAPAPQQDAHPAPAPSGPQPAPAQPSPAPKPSPAPSPGQLPVGPVLDPVKQLLDALPLPLPLGGDTVNG